LITLSSEEFRRLEVFGNLWESLSMLVLSSKIWHSQDKNPLPATWKKSARIVFMASNYKTTSEVSLLKKLCTLTKQPGLAVSP